LSKTASHGKNGTDMSLYTDLKIAKSEEDVKAAYVKALGLKEVSRNLVDIQTKEIWFEAKEAGTSPVAMFAQLLVYIKLDYDKGKHLPPFLSVIDREKAALMDTANAMLLLKDKSIDWPKSGSKAMAKTKASQDFVAKVSGYISAHYVVYNIDSDEKQFISAVKSAIKEGKIIRTPITPDNLRQVFDKWIEKIGHELENVSEADYALLFFADIMHDGTKTAMKDLPARLLFDGPKPVFLLNGKQYDLISDKGYRNFWAIYHRPPDEEYRSYLLERRDSLLPNDERTFKGAFYTPLKVVDKAYDLLAETLGKNWQQNYIVWDMCCGVGNLEVKHSNHRNIFMSTLDQADIDVMKASHICVEATKFQYDYLNDDIDAFGQIDYGLTNKVPMELQQAIADAKAGKKGAKKILVLMNPPYAEAMNAENLKDSSSSESKIGVADTNAAGHLKNFGYASRELFVQFVVRISQELPNATLAMFSKLKYVNAPNFQPFREWWKADYKNGFIVPSKLFDGLKGKFPIGFLIWQIRQNSKTPSLWNSVQTTVLDFDTTDIGTKSFYAIAADQLLGDWIERPRSNDVDALPLKNALSPATGTKDVRGRKWADGAIGGMISKGSDLQNASDSTALFSSGYCSAGGFFVTSNNLWQAAIVFSVRLLIKQTWINDRDQFLQPSEPLTEEFKTDCLLWMLFNGSNLSAGADGLQWNGKQWSLVNHFIPFSESEVGSSGRFESRFMVDYLRGKKLSSEAKSVLDAGRELWRTYHETQMPFRIRNEFKLNRDDVGWYQIRKSLEANSENEMTDFSDFKAAYEALTNKLRPMVYSLGFLKQ
jgi:hypothetical protein